MKLTIKQILHLGEVFAPLTVAEAVLVNDESEGKVLTLSKVLKKKIEDVDVSEDPSLITVREGNKIVLKHSSSLQANSTPSALKILHDSAGHIIETLPAGKLSIYVNNLIQNQFDTSEDKSVLFGDDFTTEEDKIKLNWKNL